MVVNRARISKIECVPLDLHMRRPFVTSFGRKDISRNLLIILKLDNGITGLGEASASLAWPEDNQKTMAAALQKMIPRLIGSEIKPYKKLIKNIWAVMGKHPTAAAALECVILDAFTKNCEISLWKFFGGKKRFITTGFTISAWPPEEAALAAQKMYVRGFRRFKIKVTGKNPDEDLARILRVAQNAPKAKLLIDANQGFTAKEAIHFAQALKILRLPVELLEQPVAKDDWEGLKQVERKGKIPVAADESARSVEDARRLIQKKIVSVINIKLAKSGVLGALEIMRLAQSKGVRLMIGCMAESAIGLTPSVHLALGTGAFRFIDLDSHLLVHSPKNPPGFTTRGPRLSVDSKRPGSGSELKTSNKSSPSPYPLPLPGGEGKVCLPLGGARR